MSESITKRIKKEMKSNEWSPPTPFDTIKRPPFPINCLPLTVRNYVLAVAEATQTPIDMAGVAALAVMATCVQGKFEVEGKPDWIEPLNLYSVIVAKPAERKSAVMTLLTAPIIRYESEWNEKHKSKIEQNATEKKCLEKRIAKLEDEVTRDLKALTELMQKREELTNFKELHPLRLLADDATPEALTSLLSANNGKMSVISSEGGIFEILRGRYSASVNIDVFLKAHCGDVIKIDRKGREHESIENPCLTVLLSIQPQVLEALMSNDIFRGRGLTARFLYSIPISKVGSRNHDTKPIPDAHASDYKKLCYSLLDIPADNGIERLRLSKKTYELSAKFATKLEPHLIDKLEGIADFAGKLHGAVLRIAGILHLIEGKANRAISYDTMNNAIKLGFYFLNHAKVAYQLMGTDKQLQDAKYILQQIKKQTDMELTRYDIFRLCRGHFSKDEEMTPAFELLAEYGYIREAETKYKGVGRKPSQKYEVNPFFMD